MHRSSTAVLHGQHQDTEGPARQRPHTRGGRCRLQPTLFSGTHSPVVVQTINSVQLIENYLCIAHYSVLSK